MAFFASILKFWSIWDWFDISYRPAKGLFFWNQQLSKQGLSLKKICRLFHGLCEGDCTESVARPMEWQDIQSPENYLTFPWQLRDQAHLSRWSKRHGIHGFPETIQKIRSGKEIPQIVLMQHIQFWD